ncbi:hypothetical protein [Roseateles sp. P5_E7]
MEIAALLILAALFGFLAYDARRLSVDPRDLPYEALSGETTESVAGISRAELDERKGWLVRHGERDYRGAHLLWIILAAVCLVGAVWQFFA